MTEEIPGLDTINIIKHAPPNNEIFVSKELLGVATKLQAFLSNKMIAVIPYCMMCKEPLTWVRDGNIFFKCPKCGVVWKDQSIIGTYGESQFG